MGRCSGFHLSSSTSRRKVLFIVCASMLQVRSKCVPDYCVHLYAMQYQVHLYAIQSQVHLQVK